MKKKTHFLMAGLVTAVISCAGCSSSVPSHPNGTAPASTSESADDFQPPVRGETKDQVLAQYDEPDQVFESSEGGETWIYVFGKGKLFIPFYGSFAHLRHLTIDFDQYGRVRSWETGIHRAL
jgi:outer membrane protein assembly factor BamE (lipoprotein component of BamABCDE complex)